MILANMDAHKEDKARSDHIYMQVAFQSWQEHNFSKNGVLKMA